MARPTRGWAVDLLHVGDDVHGGGRGVGRREQPRLSAEAVDGRGPRGRRSRRCPSLRGAQGLVLSDVSCTAANACTAVGTDANQHGFIERWDGSAWTQQSAPTADVIRVSCTSVFFCAAVGTDAIETWNGLIWTAENSPPPRRRHRYSDWGCHAPPMGRARRPATPTLLARALPRCAAAARGPCSQWMIPRGPATACGG